MLLGKRPRPPMKRTTSMKELGVDVNMKGVELPLQSQNMTSNYPKNTHKQMSPNVSKSAFMHSSLSPRNYRSNGGNFGETTDHSFLSSCSLCKRRLGPDRDIYMYRGEIAFCSLECRRQQMNQDERKGKCSLVSIKKEASAAASEASSDGERVAAA